MLFSSNILSMNFGENEKLLISKENEEFVLTCESNILSDDEPEKQYIEYTCYRNKKGKMVYIKLMKKLYKPYKKVNCRKIERTLLNSKFQEIFDKN